MKDGSLDLGTNVKPITPNRASSIRGTKIPTVASDNLANSQSDSRTVNAKQLKPFGTSPRTGNISNDVRRIKTTAWLSRQTRPKTAIKNMPNTSLSEMGTGTSAGNVWSSSNKRPPPMNEFARNIRPGTMKTTEVSTPASLQAQPGCLATNPKRVSFSSLHSYSRTAEAKVMATFSARHQSTTRKCEIYIYNNTPLETNNSPTLGTGENHMTRSAKWNFHHLSSQEGNLNPLRGTNISHLGKFGTSSTQKCFFGRDMLVPWRVTPAHPTNMRYQPISPISPQQRAAMAPKNPPPFGLFVFPCPPGISLWFEHSKVRVRDRSWLGIHVRSLYIYMYAIYVCICRGVQTCAQRWSNICGKVWLFHYFCIFLLYMLSV